MKNVPSKYIFYRSIQETYQSYEWIEAVIPKSLVQERYQIQELVPYFEKLDQYFYADVVDYRFMSVYLSYRKYGLDQICKNIIRILKSYEEECRQMGEANPEPIIQSVELLLQKEKYEEILEIFSAYDRGSLGEPFNMWCEILDVYKLQRDGKRGTIFDTCKKFTSLVDRYRSFVLFLQGNARLLYGENVKEIGDYMKENRISMEELYVVYTEHFGFGKDYVEELCHMVSDQCFHSGLARKG